MQNKKIFIFVIIALYVLGTVGFIVSAEETSTAKNIIEKNIPCSELNRTELISLGDYYMSQALTPEQHEYMDNMMGGDSSIMAENMHLSFAYRYYCNETNNYSPTYGMMGYANSYPNYNSGMMGNYYPANNQNMGTRYSLQTNNILVFELGLIFAGLLALVIILSKKRVITKNKKSRK